MRPSMLKKFRKECNNGEMWRAARAEFFGTLFLVFFGCGAAVRLPNENFKANEKCPQKSHNANAILQTALSFALIGAVLTAAFVRLSGAYFNPSITIAHCLTRRLTWPRAVVYMIAQLLGAVTGGGMLYGMTAVPIIKESTDGATLSTLVKVLTSNSSVYSKLNLCVNRVPNVHVLQAFGLEFMCSLVNTLAFCVAWHIDRINILFGSSLIGASLCVTHIVALPYTGAALNPARAFSPALILNEWTHHWIFWLGPILGAMVGAFTFEYTQERQSEIQVLRNLLYESRGSVKKVSQGLSSQNGEQTAEMTFTPSSTFEDLRMESSAL